MEFKPSIKPDVFKIMIAVVLILIAFITASKGFYDPESFTIDLTQFLGNQNLSVFNIFDIVFFILSIYCLFKIFHIIYIKLNYKYSINNVQISIDEGILFKTERTSPIRNIKNVDILTPSILQLILNIRTLRLEIDGIDGYDEYFVNVKDYEKVKDRIYANFQN